MPIGIGVGQRSYRDPDHAYAAEKNADRIDLTKPAFKSSCEYGVAD